MKLSDLDYYLQDYIYCYSEHFIDEPTPEDVAEFMHNEYWRHK